MARTKIVLNSNEVRRILRSPQMIAACQECADGVQSRAGEGFKTEVRRYPERNGVAIVPDSTEAYYRNLEENTLLKAIGGK